MPSWNSSDQFDWSSLDAQDDADLAAGLDREGPAPRCRKTRAFPGTPDKIAVMEARYRLRVALFNRLDAPLTDDLVLLMDDGLFGDGLGRADRRKVGIGRVAAGGDLEILEAPRLTDEGRRYGYPSDARTEEERARDRARKREWRKKHPGKWRRKKREEKEAAGEAQTPAKRMQVQNTHLPAGVTFAGMAEASHAANLLGSNGRTSEP